MSASTFIYTFVSLLVMTCTATHNQLQEKESDEDLELTVNTIKNESTDAIIPLEGQVFALGKKKHTRHETSGLTLVNKTLYTIIDNDNRALFRLDRNASKKIFTVKKAIKLKKKDRKALQRKKVYRFDLEGIAFCHDRFYVADERERGFITVTPSGSSHFTAIAPRRDLLFAHANYGIEGIACSDDRKFIYAINQHLPALVMKVEVSSGKVTTAFTPDMPEANLAILSGATFYNHFLFVLRRERSQILKIDPHSQKTVATYSFQSTVEKHHFRKSPKGTAEGLAIDANHIYIINDNNGQAWHAHKKDKRARLFIFNHPK